MAQDYKKKMDNDRCMELLNAVIDHIAVGESTKEQIGRLVSIGFTTDELVKYFAYSQSDIDDYLEDAGEEDDYE